MFGPGDILMSYSHSLEDINKTITVCEIILEKIKEGIKNNSLESMLEGKLIKTVMTF